MGSPTASRQEADGRRRIATAPALLSAALLISWLLVLLAPPPSPASGCTVTWVGDVNGAWYGGASGTDTNWSDDGFPDADDHACLGTGAAPYTVRLGAAATVDHFSVDAGVNLQIDGATLRSEAASSNAGTIELATSSSALATESGDEGDAEALTSTGTIRMPLGGLIHGDLVNRGALIVGRAAAFRQRFEARRPTLTNEGTIAVDTGAVLRFDDSVLGQAPGGEIHGPGAVDLLGDSATLQVAGGSIGATADVNLSANNSDLTFLAGPAVGNVDVDAATGDHLLSGDVPAGFSIDVEADVALRSTSSLTNSGRIQLRAPTATLATEDGSASSVETLTNAGVIDLSAGGLLHGDVLNTGTLSVSGSTGSFRRRYEGRRPTLTNAGILDVASGAGLRFDASVLEQASGGEIRGTGSVDLRGDTALLRIAGGSIAPGADVNLDASDSDIEFASAVASGGVDVAAGSGTHLLGGDVPAGFSLRVGDATTLRAVASFANRGRIELSAPGAALATENGSEAEAETLTNEGVIDLAGGGALSGDVVNRGALRVGAPASFGFGFEGRRPLLVNEAMGSLDVAAAGVLDASAALPLANAGTVTVSGRLSGEGLEQTGGSTTLAASGAEIFVGTGNDLALSGGTLGGVGTVGPGVENTGGTVSPGESPGTLAIAGDYAQRAGGSLAVEIDGPGPGSGFDQLRATGAVTLDGGLSIRGGAFSPAPGDAFRVVEGSSVTGAFATVDAGGGPWEVLYGPAAVDVVVPVDPPTSTPCLRTWAIGILHGPSRALVTLQTALRSGDQRGYAIHLDLRGRVGFQSSEIERVDCSGSRATITGTGRVGRAPVEFVVELLDGRAERVPDEYSIELSNGYAAQGRLLFGDVGVVAAEGDAG